MKLAVTGATGHLGQLVVNDLLDKNGSFDVIAVVRNEEKAAPLAARGAEIRVANYQDREALEAAFAGVDRLLLISSSEIGQRIAQHTNVIEAAKAAGVKFIAYTSAPKAQTTDLILAPDHKATEDLIMASGLDYTILRNNWYTENYLNQVKTARQIGSIVAAAGEGRVASATRADYAAGAAAVLAGSGHEGKIYELSGDYAWNFNELAEAISEIIGQPVAYKPVSPEEMTNILKNAGLDEGTAGFVVGMDQNIASGALAESTEDLTKLIGRPTTPLKEGLEENLAG